MNKNYVFNSNKLLYICCARPNGQLLLAVEKGRTTDISGNYLNDMWNGRDELKKETSDGEKKNGKNDGQSTHWRLGKKFWLSNEDLNTENISFDTVEHDCCDDVEDNEILDPAGGDSGDEYLVDTGAANSQTSEGTENGPDSQVMEEAGMFFVSSE